MILEPRLSGVTMGVRMLELNHWKSGTEPKNAATTPAHCPRVMFSGWTGSGISGLSPLKPIRATARQIASTEMSWVAHSTIAAVLPAGKLSSAALARAAGSTAPSPAGPPRCRWWPR